MDSPPDSGIGMRPASLSGSSMTAVAELFKAIAHPVRVSILELLSRAESSIPELSERTGVKDTHLSRHLTQLRAQHLITSRRCGGHLLFRLADPETAALLSAARSVLRARAATEATYLGQLTHPNPGPGNNALAGPLPEEHYSPLETAALETALESRSLITRACEAIAARTGCSLETAAQRLIVEARARNVSLLEAATDETRAQDQREP